MGEAINIKFGWKTRKRKDRMVKFGVKVRIKMSHNEIFYEGGRLDSFGSGQEPMASSFEALVCTKAGCFLTR